MNSEDQGSPQSRLQQARARLDELSKMSPEELEKAGGPAEMQRAVTEFLAAEQQSRSDPDYPVG